MPLGGEGGGKGRWGLALLLGVWGGGHHVCTVGVEYATQSCVEWSLDMWPIWNLCTPCIYLHIVLEVHDLYSTLL